MEDGKGKKFVYQFQGFSTDNDIKKKNMKWHYYRKKGHIKLEYRKLKANQIAEIVSKNKRIEESKT